MLATLLAALLASAPLSTGPCEADTESTVCYEGFEYRIVEVLAWCGKEEARGQGAAELCDAAGWLDPEGEP